MKHNYTLNFFDLFKYSSVRGDFLKLSLMMFIFFFLLYGPPFVLDQLNMDIFMLSLINVASQFITFPVFAYFIETPRRVTQIKIYIAATVFSFLVLHWRLMTASSATKDGSSPLLLSFSSSREFWSIWLESSCNLRLTRHSLHRFVH